MVTGDKTEAMPDKLSQLDSRVDALELSLLQQEHRPLRVFYNLWAYRHDPIRRPATVWALFSWIFSPGIVAAAGVSVLAVAGVLIAYQANLIITEQNQLLIAQNRTVLEEQRGNLYFRRLNRRTYLLSVLYNADELVRVKKEALAEFLRLDREVKQTRSSKRPETERAKRRRAVWQLRFYSGLA